MAMKKPMPMIVLITGLAGMAGAALADPVYGIWKTAKDDNGIFGHIEIVACGANICSLWSGHLIPAELVCNPRTLERKSSGT
jgi:hypothetical protein